MLVWVVRSFLIESVTDMKQENQLIINGLILAGILAGILLAWLIVINIVWMVLLTLLITTL